MLRHLHIENYTIIQSLDLEFRSGLNVLTGETGSGKSIVVDAVELLLGGKASTDLIRSGSERARISGVLSAGPSSAKASTAQGKRSRSANRRGVAHRSGMRSGRAGARRCGGDGAVRAPLGTCRRR